MWRFYLPQQRAAAQPFWSDAAVRAAGFVGAGVPLATHARGRREICSVVVRVVRTGWPRRRLADVSDVALNNSVDAQERPAAGPFLRGAHYAAKV